MNATNMIDMISAAPATMEELPDGLIKNSLYETEVRLAELIPLPGGTVDLANGEVLYPDGQRAELSGREMALMRYLAHNPGRIISRDELLQQVWDLNPHFVITRTIDMHVAKLRDKLHEDPEHPTVLRTVRGQGYQFNPPVHPAVYTGAAKPVQRPVANLALCG